MSVYGVCWHGWDGVEGEGEGEGDCVSRYHH